MTGPAENSVSGGAGRASKRKVNTAPEKRAVISWVLLSLGDGCLGS